MRDLLSKTSQTYTTPLLFGPAITSLTDNPKLKRLNLRALSFRESHAYFWQWSIQLWMCHLLPRATKVHLIREWELKWLSNCRKCGLQLSKLHPDPHECSCLRRSHPPMQNPAFINGILLENLRDLCVWPINFVIRGMNKLIIPCRDTTSLPKSTTLYQMSYARCRSSRKLSDSYSYNTKIY